VSEVAFQPLISPHSRHRRQFKIKINPQYLLIGLILISGLFAVDNLRFNQSITKPEHRYFTDPNNYLELK
jgi:hypothetical protein